MNHNLKAININATSSASSSSSSSSSQYLLGVRCIYGLLLNWYTTADCCCAVLFTGSVAPLFHADRYFCRLHSQIEYNSFLNGNKFRETFSGALEIIFHSFISHEFHVRWLFCFTLWVNEWVCVMWIFVIKFSRWNSMLMMMPLSKCLINFIIHKWIQQIEIETLHLPQSHFINI